MNRRAKMHGECNFVKDIEQGAVIKQEHGMPKYNSFFARLDNFLGTTKSQPLVLTCNTEIP
jgi:hypothetical protein